MTPAQFYISKDKKNSLPVIPSIRIPSSLQINLVESKNSEIIYANLGKNAMRNWQTQLVRKRAYFRNFKANFQGNRKGLKLREGSSSMNLKLFRFLLYKVLFLNFKSSSDMDFTSELCINYPKLCGFFMCSVFFVEVYKLLILNWNMAIYGLNYVIVCNLVSPKFC